MTPPSAKDFLRRRGLLPLWVGLLAAPLGWFLCLQVSYILVPWSCATGRQFLLHLATLAALLLAAGGGVIAWRTWQQTGLEWPGEAGGVIPRSRFMAVLGILTSGMFFLVILAQGIPNFILHACQP